ncbi:hypothetical protein LIER_04118 [Lithospermum erythrorhizon]|uniref:Uncharacterized protein n=1 Tax=Lithospermum erythrorhizon TaxID=34254 RepID=A0AAV3NVR3_LITER
MDMVGRGGVMEFPVREGAMSCSPPRLRLRLRLRLTESKSSPPSTVEEIQQKLRHANLHPHVIFLSPPPSPPPVIDHL